MDDENIHDEAASPDDVSASQGGGVEEPVTDSALGGGEPGEIRKAQFSALTPDQKNKNPLDLNFLMDISLELTIELGRAVLSFKDILMLRDGAVVELNKLAGDPVDVFVNKKLIARGEVVVIDDNFGVRVTDILSPTELIKNLK